jgi:hypothetical protein
MLASITLYRYKLKHLWIHYMLSEIFFKILKEEEKERKQG